jgi:hypothetical protein
VHHGGFTVVIYYDAQSAKHEAGYYIFIRKINNKGKRIPIEDILFL